MKIAAVHGLSTAAEPLRAALSARPAHQLAWTADNGWRALQLCVEQRPDLLLLDAFLNGEDTVQLARKIMAHTPCIILVITEHLKTATSRVFEIAGEGAIDAVELSLTAGTVPQRHLAPFLQKIDVVDKLLHPQRSVLASDNLSDSRIFQPREKLLAIGASAGGPAAISRVLSALPADFPAAVIVVQHLDERFTEGLATWLASSSALPVHIAGDGEHPERGSVLVAGGKGHLRLTATGRLSYTSEPKELPYTPSIDLLFESISAHWGGQAVGVLLTGMGWDGARGLRAMRNKGHYTIAQDRATSAVFGMPKVAATLGAAVDVLALDQIAPSLVRAFQSPLQSGALR